jgi:hypothetical protein
MKREERCGSGKKKASGFLPFSELLKLGKRLGFSRNVVVVFRVFLLYVTFVVSGGLKDDFSAFRSGVLGRMFVRPLVVVF